MKTWALILQALETHGHCALVSVVKTEGSAPRDAGARMIVTPEGFHGTIGGGTLEWRAIAAAQTQLNGEPGLKVSSYSLGPDLGQCCGGRVQLATETFDRNALGKVHDLAERERNGQFTLKRRVESLDIVESYGAEDRRIFLFGAGHVGRALILALAPLPFEVVWVDPRPSAFPRAVPQNVRLVETLNPVGELTAAPNGSLVLVMSHSHALDLAITDAALRSPHVAHVGLIGSASKRARFEKRLREAGISEDRVAGLICPIGLPGIASKEPAMIAAATAAQLLVLDERLRAGAEQIDLSRDPGEVRRGGRS